MQNIVLLTIMVGFNTKLSFFFTKQLRQQRILLKKMLTSRKFQENSKRMFSRRMVGSRVLHTPWYQMADCGPVRIIILGSSLHSPQATFQGSVQDKTNKKSEELL